MIEQAEIVGLAKTLIIIITIYWGFKLFSRYVLPYLMRFFLTYLGKKVQNNMRNQGFQGSNYNQSQEQQTSDNVYVKNSSKTQAKSTKLDGVGEYVDFEEVD